MLSGSKIIGFVPTTDAARAREFFEGKLGLRFISDDPFATVFDANGNMLRVVKAKEIEAKPFTILGWEVTGIRDLVTALTAKGVVFERYGFVPQDDLGIWATPDGSSVAWFKDPDGNVLSVSEHPAH